MASVEKTKTKKRKNSRGKEGISFGSIPFPRSLSGLTGLSGLSGLSGFERLVFSGLSVYVAVYAFSQRVLFSLLAVIL